MQLRDGERPIQKGECKNRIKTFERAKLLNADERKK